MLTFPFFIQQNEMDCGPTCLYMVSKYYGRNFDLEKLRELTEIGKEGVRVLKDYQFSYHHFLQTMLGSTGKL